MEGRSEPGGIVWCIVCGKTSRKTDWPQEEDRRPIADRMRKHILQGLGAPNGTETTP